MGGVLWRYFWCFAGLDGVFCPGEGEDGGDRCGEGLAQCGDDHAHGGAGGKEVVDEEEVGGGVRLGEAGG